jgi:hypothetical protein
MSASDPPKNRTGAIAAVIVIIALILMLTIFMKIISPDDSAGSTGESGSPSTGVIVFQSFYIEPERINAGKCATIHWVVENADQVQLLRDGSVVLDQGKSSDSYRDCPEQAAVYRYQLEASNNENANWIELQLIVDE